MSEVNSIEVGNKVRSFDFATTIKGEAYGRDLEGDRASYVEGEVIGFEHKAMCSRYVIRVERRVFGGEEVTQVVANAHAEEHVVYPPVNGTPRTLGGVTDGVELI